MRALGRDPWIERSDEPCPSCLHRYALEMEVRCVACDRPLCPVCVVRVRESREWFCPECRSDAGSDDPDVAAPGPVEPTAGEQRR